MAGAFRDDYVFAGYEDAARKEDRRIYHLGGWEPHGWWTWAEFEKWCSAESPEYAALREGATYADPEFAAVGNAPKAGSDQALAMGG